MVLGSLLSRLAWSTPDGENSKLFLLVKVPKETEEAVAKSQDDFQFQARENIFLDRYSVLVRKYLATAIFAW